MSEKKPNGIASVGDWQAAAEAQRRARAVRLTLPSGTTILAARPEPLEWVVAGRLPARLITAAVEPEGDTAHEMTTEEVLELAGFASHLVEASVLEPPIGEGPGEISLRDIPAEDCVFIFEWACRALSESEEAESDEGLRQPRRRRAEESASRRLDGFRSR